MLCHVDCLGAVGGADFAHDVADMCLDCAFAHAEFVGNDLVGLPLAKMG